MGLALTCLLACQPAAAQERPFNVQLWDFYRWNSNGSQENKADFRFFQDLDLDGGWVIRFREDLPVITTDRIGPENKEGGWSTGIGDVFVQAIAVSPPVLPDITVEAGLRLVFPTGGLAPYGNGSYQLGPSFGVSYHNPKIFNGLTVAPRLRYLVSVVKAESEAKDVRKLQLYPRIDLQFEEWRVGFWVENPIIYNQVSGDWFVPLDIMVTHDVGEHFTLRLGGATALLQSPSEYNHMVYGRLSYHF